MSGGDERLQLIRELRAMGAVRVRVGDLAVAFASPTPQNAAQPSAAASHSEPERERREEDDDEILFRSAGPGGLRI